MKKKNLGKFHINIEGFSTTLCGRSTSTIKYHSYQYTNRDIEAIRRYYTTTSSADILEGHVWCKVCAKVFDAGL